MHLQLAIIARDNSAHAAQAAALATHKAGEAEPTAATSVRGPGSAAAGLTLEDFYEALVHYPTPCLHTRMAHPN